MVDSTATGQIEVKLARVDPSLIIYGRERPPEDTRFPKPTIPAAPVPRKPGKSLILNIETEGFDPLIHKIIAVGVHDPMVPNMDPVIIMDMDERVLIQSICYLIQEIGYTELIGYGIGFDFRFILIKAMYYNISCKEFYDCSLYDLMQIAGQGKLEFVYKAPQPPSLSELADYLWGYPKAFTDLEMIKFWRNGELSKVREFTRSQIIRIHALYTLTNEIIQNPFQSFSSGNVSPRSSENTPTEVSNSSPLTIPEANLPATWTAKCPVDLSEHEVPLDQSEFTCPIDGTLLRRDQ